MSDNLFPPWEVPLPDSGKSVFVAMSQERLWFILNLTKTYFNKRYSKGELTQQELKWLESFMDHIKVAILSIE